MKNIPLPSASVTITTKPNTMTTSNTPTKVPDLTSYSPKDTSWAQSLHNYVSMKHYSPEMPSSQYRFVRAKSLDWRVEKFNPVRQQYNDRQEESQQSRIEQETTLRQLNRAKDLQLRTESTRDFLKGWKPKTSQSSQHSPKVLSKSESYDMKQYKRRPNQPHATDECKTDFYSLIGKRTRLNWSMRDRTPFDLLTLKDRQLLSETQNKKESTSSSPLHHRRIETNQQPAHDYIKQQTQNAYKKYRENHFDPVLQRFLNPHTEISYIKERKQKSQAKQSLKEERLPPFVKTADSQAYDLFSHHVKKEEMMPKVDHTVNRVSATKKYANGKKQLRNYTRKRNLQEERQQKKVERRFKERSNRWRESIQHGYDIIHNKPHIGVDSIQPRISRELLDRKSMWATANGETAVRQNRSLPPRGKSGSSSTEKNRYKKMLKRTFGSDKAPTRPLVSAGSARSAIREKRRHSQSLREGGVSRSSVGVVRPRTAGFL